MGILSNIDSTLNRSDNLVNEFNTRPVSFEQYRKSFSTLNHEKALKLEYTWHCPEYLRTVNDWLVSSSPFNNTYEHIYIAMWIATSDSHFSDTVFLQVQLKNGDDNFTLYASYNSVVNLKFKKDNNSLKSRYKSIFYDMYHRFISPLVTDNSNILKNVQLYYE